MDILNRFFELITYNISVYPLTYVFLFLGVLFFILNFYLLFLIGRVLFQKTSNDLRIYYIFPMILIIMSVSILLSISMAAGYIHGFISVSLTLTTILIPVQLSRTRLSYFSNPQGELTKNITLTILSLIVFSSVWISFIKQSSLPAIISLGSVSSVSRAMYEIINVSYMGSRWMEILYIVIPILLVNLLLWIDIKVLRRSLKTKIITINYAISIYFLMFAYLLFDVFKIFHFSDPIGSSFSIFIFFYVIISVQLMVIREARSIFKRNKYTHTIVKTALECISSLSKKKKFSNADLMRIKLLRDTLVNNRDSYEIVKQIKLLGPRKKKIMFDLINMVEQDNTI